MEEQEQQPIDVPYNLPQYPTGEDTAGLIQQLDPSGIVEEILHQLRGEELVSRYDREGQIIKSWVKKRKKPLMNEEGIHSFMVNIRTLVNLSTVMGKADDEDLPKIASTMSDTVIAKVMQNRAAFAIDKAELSTVVDLICLTSYVALKRSHNALTIGLMKRATQEHIISRQHDSSKKGGMFGLLKK